MSTEKRKKPANHAKEHESRGAARLWTDRSLVFSFVQFVGFVGHCPSVLIREKSVAPWSSICARER
jgi:hypothetical protein